MSLATFLAARSLKLPRRGRLAEVRRRLAGCTSGVALVEFALTAPILLAMGMLGAETAYFTVTHLRISQVAMQIADNASRVGETDMLMARRVFERDVNDVFLGGEKYGEPFGLYQHGRVILSSLQRNAQGGQNIRWQRCRGAKEFTSSYGLEGDGASGTAFPGMGEAQNRIQASQGTAVMFVEIAYDYQALTPLSMFGGRQIRYTAAFNIRDERDLTQLYNTNPAGPVARCNVYSAGRPT
jgi:hypothetical protein